MNAAQPNRVPAAVLLAGLLVIGLVWIFIDTFSRMAQIWWTSASFNHCLLIAPASVWLIWRRRAELARTPARPSVTGFVVFFVSAAIWSVGALGHILTVQSFAVVGMLVAALWAVLGTAVARVIAFPLAYLFFLVPFGQFLVPQLMDLTADLTVMAARVTGVPVHKTGLYFLIPNGSFKIVEACSGIRMLIASLAIAVLFAHLAYRSWRRRILFVATMVGVSVLANSVRTWLVVMTAYHFGMEAIADHIFVGYVVFGVVIVGMLLIGSRFAEAGAPQADSTDAIPAGRSIELRGMLIVTVAVVVVAVLAPRLAAVLEAAMQARGVPPALSLPDARAGWTGPLPVSLDWEPQYIGYDHEISGAYERAGGRVDVYLLSWERQTQGAETVSALNRPFDPDRWARLTRSTGTLTADNRHRIPYVQLELRRADGRLRTIRYWYVVDGHAISSAAHFKLRELARAATGRPTPATLVAISAEHGRDGADAGSTLDSFIRDIYLPVAESAQHTGAQTRL